MSKTYLYWTVFVGLVFNIGMAVGFRCTEEAVRYIFVAVSAGLFTIMMILCPLWFKEPNE